MLEIIESVLKEIEYKEIKYGKVDSKIGKILEILYPNGINKDKIGESMFVIHVLEKICRIINEFNNSNEVTESYKDLIGYGILGFVKDKKNGKT